MASDALAIKNTCSSTPNKMTTSYLVCRPTESESFLSLMSFWRFIHTSFMQSEARHRRQATVDLGYSRSLCYL